MKVCTCVLLFGIFAYTNSTTRGQRKNYDLSFILAHANVLESNSVEYPGDTKNLGNVHKSITREISAIDKNQTMEAVFKTARVETLTDFIQEAVHIINTYKDTTFKGFFRTLDHELRTYHYRDGKFSELMQNPDTRSWLAETLTIIRGETGSFIKANINKMADMIRDKTYGNDVTELLDYINSLYRHTELKFHRVLKELKDYEKTESLNTQKTIVKRGVQHILFDHFTELDSNIRQELKKRIVKFWNRFKNNNPASSAEVSNSPETNAFIESVNDSIKVSQDIIQKVKELETYSKKYLNTNWKNERSVSDLKEDIFDSGQDTESFLMVNSKVKPRSSKDKQQQHGKPEKIKSKNKHAETNMFAEYNAEIDVQLANTELLKALGIFKPVPDMKHATTSYQKSVTQTIRHRFDLYTTPVRGPRGWETGPESPEIIPKKPNALRKPPYSTNYDSMNEYLKPLRNLRNQISNLFSKESKVAIQFMNDNNIRKGLDTTTQRTRLRFQTRQRSLKRRHQKNPQTNIKANK